VRTSTNESAGCAGARAQRHLGRVLQARRFSGESGAMFDVCMAVLFIYLVIDTSDQLNCEFAQFESSHREIEESRSSSRFFVES